MSRLFLLRHGQSVWNKESRFTGSVDVELTDEGRQEALSAGKLIQEQPFEGVYVSALKRAIETSQIALAVSNREKCPVISTPALNERNYGDLQGLNKDAVRREYGSEKVELWRRSYDAIPPGGESLKQTCERVIPYYRSEILPRLMGGENILVVAHGNSLRGLIKELEGLSANQVIHVEIPTGVPISYDIDTKGMAANKIIYGSKEIR